MRRNIGLLVDDLNAVFTKEALKGAELGAIAIDANMYIFPGMYLDDQSMSDDHLPHEYQYNTLFQFAKNRQLDILYIMMGMIGGRVSDREKSRFLAQYLGIPVVILYANIPGYNSIIFDNQVAFMQGIRHIIVDKGAKKVGYVSGPKTNIDAMERLEAYKKVLAETALDYSEDYIIYGNFEESTGSQVRDFVAAHPELDALVFANDRMARGGYKALEELGVVPGKDLLVIGFDNSPFAAILDPPLTTVEANAAELSFQAITNVENYLMPNVAHVSRVNTHLVHRSSCGCLESNDEFLAQTLLINQMTDPAVRADMIKKINRYLFGGYIVGEKIQRVKADLGELFPLLADLVDSGEPEALREEIQKVFVRLVRGDLFRYTTVELFTHVTSAFQAALRTLVTDPKRYLFTMDLFSTMYRSIAVTNFQLAEKIQLDAEQLSRVVNSMNIGNAQSGADQMNYRSALLKLSSVGVKSAYLYSYVQPIQHPKDTAFQVPDTMLFRAYSQGEKAFGIVPSKQSIPTSNLLVNEYTPKDHRYTMIVCALFSQLDLYGVLMCETDLDHFRNIPTVSIHLSTTLKTLFLLEQQKSVQQDMKKDLEKLSESNQALSERSKTDHLTGLYNRWGFMESLKDILKNPMNEGKTALVLYADMDNLKTINDEHGHDEGDFALCEIAAILKEAFRNTDVVSRFGGDEFVAFALLGIPDYERIMKQRIAEITERHNEAAGKPYRIEMSTGICEVSCSPSLDIDIILETADRKLYAEKKSKKQR